MVHSCTQCEWPPQEASVWRLGLCHASLECASAARNPQEPSLSSRALITPDLWLRHTSPSPLGWPNCPGLFLVVSVARSDVRELVVWERACLSGMGLGLTVMWRQCWPARYPCEGCGAPPGLCWKRSWSVGIRLNKHKPNIYFKVGTSPVTWSASWGLGCQHVGWGGAAAAPPSVVPSFSPPAQERRWHLLQLTVTR